ncbi:alpha/beta-hydrolase [Tilletiaria anomala UBC 951]|uniref:Alpha/beta-hydrolase n=1 Tax=Tilletiaria anomala (strain ATCC 24038 / CBS 436.72 / UBC 951) TaxID=1037660 RepID=A0A066VKH2_TILAU|nr:alpha/beta-hydrolase [Tilletiaria anomala UBC 951]KDN41966.1 alpha/beta-hydrolase [Tilletiaria anomala UBC 951]
MATNTNVTIHTFVYKHASSLDLQLDLLLPKGADAASASSCAPLPIFYWHHGGGAIQGRRQAVPPHMLHAANTHRFAIISPDYRLAPQVRLDAICEDLVDAFRFAVDELPAKAKGVKLDTHNILVSGSSVGGFLALLVALGMCPALALSSSSSASLLARIKGVPIIYPITTFDVPFFRDAQEPFLGYLLKSEAEDSAFKTFVDPSSPVCANTDASSGDVNPLRNKFYMYAQQTAPVSGFQQLVYGDQLIEAGWLQSSDTVVFLRKNAEAIKQALSGGRGARLYAIHGDADKAVDVSQVRDLVAAATEARVPIEYEELKGIDHMFDYDPKITLDGFYAWCVKAWGL